MWSIANKPRVRQRLFALVAATASFTLAAFAPSSQASTGDQPASRPDTTASQTSNATADNDNDRFSQDPTAQTIRAILASGNWKPGKVALNWNALRQFYGRRDFQPAWGSQDDAEQALKALSQADREGLSPADYAARDIRPPANDNPQSRAHFDLLLTNSLLLYAHDARVGRATAEQVYDDASMPAQHYDAVGDLASALANQNLDGYLSALPPPQEGYRALRDLLGRYREIAAHGGWPTIPAGGLSRRHGARLVAERLSIEDGNPSDSGVDADQLGQAIARFQQHHGLNPSGRLDKRTIDAMNVDAGARAQQIALNMERWRWLPRTPGARYIEVNVPSASLEVYDNGQSVLKSRVVVGRETDPTPLLRAEAKSITVNPNWNIPESIARREILPKASRNPGYLRRHHMVRGSAGHLRQLPGPDNALGAIKINMPNRFDVYLHDTPSQSAFDRSQRAESHGCMRVEQILPLASYALSGNTDEAAGYLQNLIETEQTQELPLPSPIPVYVLYWTVSAGSDGAAQFWPDIYGRDTRLGDALQKQVGAPRISML